ncbi:uncharacterized protein PODANS_5_10090 [Podospora anserina S mat+]|uniref:Podospora anserina S mat+ genomic DNA chromosome 5, supercontig 9 n=1 Tax=Podospora anserina (strain S / ATCC MYA-4624 / DSM 980 / FGSC 10383) TaxID=515849 RepID=B2ALA7_PODAN|nr:uncharacterized protein PODANS_5_10090 [Podospora anserina S mat+]CAP64745.1 unnamed protein product [Podospora anserina S mat+]CDP30144.1 Putative tyrosinase [Podospora anserina S mat+]
MKVSLGSVLLGALLASTPAEVVAHPGHPSTCMVTTKRKEFRTLSNVQKLNFLASVKCLMNRPPALSATYPASTSRWTDFLLVHQANTPFVHWVGQFLPWHRAFLQDFEDALRNECGLIGGIPYWNPALDFANLTASPVLSGPLSFGGNGVGPVVVPPGGQSSDGNCVIDGFFGNVSVRVAQGPPPGQVADRCLLRYIRQDFASYWMNPSHVATVLAQPDYATFAPLIEGDMIPPDVFPTMGIHTGGHATIGGDMSDMFTSNSDPIFYPFHANIDRLWAKWQAANPTARQYDISNPIAPRGVIQMWPNPPAGNVTLDYQLSPLKVGDSSTVTTVGQIMNTKGKGVPSAPGKPNGILCYEYVE